MFVQMREEIAGGVFPAPITPTRNWPVGIGSERSSILAGMAANSRISQEDAQVSFPGFAPNQDRRLSRQILSENDVGNDRPELDLAGSN